ncbi:MAG: carboxypeptidase regulatory-like domain-containing protein [Aquabacterium sp.]
MSLRRAFEPQNLSAFPLSALSAAVVAIVAAVPVAAQTTTSSVSGRVSNADGSPAAGATVEVLHVESGSVGRAVADADGRWQLRGLRAGGPYTITVSRGGLTDRRSDVFLALAETTALDSVLGTARVEVTGRLDNERFNRASMGSGTNIGSREINALASVQRNLQDYARTDPRLAQTDKERGEISAAGQNIRFNSITIDGVTINDTFGIESNNLPTLKQPISIDAIQSVQVNLSNYDVTQKGYTGANINAVTKSGTNDLKGALYYVYRDTSMAGDRFNRTTGGYTTAPSFKEDTKGFLLGGPIIKDKLFFFAGYEELFSSRTSPDFGPIGSPQTNVGITQSAIDAIRSIASTQYGFDAGGSTVPKGVAVTVKDTLLKLDWTINDNHRANLRYTLTDQSEPFFPNFGTRSLSLSSHWYAQAKTIETLVGQWFADWTPNLSTEVRLSKRDYEQLHNNNARLPAIAFDFTGATPPGVSSLERTLWIGTERSRHFNLLRTNTSDAYLGANWTLGAHELKFGADLSSNEIYNAFLQDANGQYKFQCESNRNYAFNNNQPINCATATTQEIESAVLENFRNGFPSAYQAQLPLAGRTLDDGVARWRLNNTGLFVQDTWAVNKQLTMTLGLRVDTTGMPDKPLKNAAVAAAVVPGNAGNNTAQTGGFGYDNSVTLDGKQLVQPRVGFNLNLGDKNTRRQVRGGIGLFEGQAANVWLSNPYSNTGIAVGFIGCGSGSELIGGVNRAACTTGIFSANPDNQPRPGGNPPSPGVDILHPDLRQPSVWKANLALDTDLPFAGLVFGAEWLYTKVNKGIYYQHLNLGPVMRTSATDGRELYYNAAGQDTNCWTTTGTTQTCGAGTVRSRALSNSAFSNVVLALPTSQGSADVLTLSLSQRPLPGLQWNAAYSRSNAKEVSPLTSSVALSNWRGRSVFNPNEEVTANSAYLTRDRFSAAVTWQQAFIGKYKSSVGLFWEGRAGKPFSWTYNNDLNGDGLAGNDLMYIPRAPGSGEVVFAGGATDEARFWATVDANAELSAAKGKVVQRNGSRTGFVNSFDLRLSQELPGFMAKHKGVISLDILNFGNLINKRWGRIEEVLFQSDGAQARSFVNYKGLTADGKYIYSTFTGGPESVQVRQTRGESQWSAQVTLKYEF